MVDSVYIPGMYVSHDNQIIRTIGISESVDGAEHINSQDIIEAAIYINGDWRNINLYKVIGSEDSEYEELYYHSDKIINKKLIVYSNVSLSGIYAITVNDFCYGVKEL